MKPPVTNNKKITVLFCPLDWGLGHASRLIPLINKYRTGGYNVIIGGTGKSSQLLRYNFTDIPFVLIGSIPVSYFFKGKWFILNILFQLPVLLYNIVNEYIVLKKIIPRYSISMVISDNRYGLRNFKIRSIIITHQISPVLPRFMRFAEYPMYKLIGIFLRRFDECWIPDFKGDQNLSGNLSHRFILPSNAKLIGPLSRFRIKSTYSSAEKYDCVIVLSGPQPELGRMTRDLINRVSGLTEKTIIICGFQDTSGFACTNPFVTIVSHLDSISFQSVLENATLIVSTAGYSGIMDLFEMGCPAILIPVKGQSEQEYLCTYLQEKGLFMYVPQEQLDFRNVASYKEKLSFCRTQMISMKNSLGEKDNDHY